jgi:hypothetical protein
LSRTWALHKAYRSRWFTDVLGQKLRSYALLKHWFDVRQLTRITWGAMYGEVPISDQKKFLQTIIMYKFCLPWYIVKIVPDRLEKNKLDS